MHDKLLIFFSPQRTHDKLLMKGYRYC